MNYLMLRFELSHDFPESGTTRFFDPREHVSAFNVMMKFQHLAFVSAKISKCPEILRHIERKDDLFQLFWRLVPRFDASKNRSYLAHFS